MYGDAWRKKSTNADGTDAFGDTVACDGDDDDDGDDGDDDDDDEMSALAVSKLASRPWSMARCARRTRRFRDGDAVI
jgi:hypothetical protein